MDEDAPLSFVAAKSGNPHVLGIHCGFPISCALDRDTSSSKHSSYATLIPGPKPGHNET